MIACSCSPSDSPVNKVLLCAVLADLKARRVDELTNLEPQLASRCAIFVVRMTSLAYDNKGVWLLAAWLLLL